MFCTTFPGPLSGLSILKRFSFASFFNHDAFRNHLEFTKRIRACWRKLVWSRLSSIGSPGTPFEEEVEHDPQENGGQAGE